MLEPIEAYINNIEFNYSEFINIIPLLLIYNKEQGIKVFNEDKLMNMLRYYKLYDGCNSSDIKDYGKYFRDNHQKFVEIEKQRQRYFNNNDKLNDYYMTNPQYLITTYLRLKRCIQNRTQYIVLKDAILLLSPLDTEHFINILLRKYSENQIKQIIKNIENGKN